MNPSSWAANSWRSKTALHQPVYEDPACVSNVLQAMRCAPPLVSEGEIAALKSEMAEAQQDRSFVLQAGECAERFPDCTHADLHAHLCLMGEMMGRLKRLPTERIIGIGRIAGQYAKPRTEDLERQGDVSFLSYKGDIVNGHDFNDASRRHDPDRMIQAYLYSAATMNFIRTHGEQILQQAAAWTDGIPHTTSGGLSGYYTSHEALLLPYEEALTRRSAIGGGHYNAGTHFVWIGMRTNAVNGSHVEYVRGLSNPVGFKVGPKTDPAALLEIAAYVNPTNEPGRLAFITRCGRDCVDTTLPTLLAAFSRTKLNILWLVDPMHGNTELLQNGTKTRRFGKIVEEFEMAHECHRASGIPLGGVHLEVAGSEVTECLGGPDNIEPDHLVRAYLSKVDPRLSRTQAIAFADMVAAKRGLAGTIHVSSAILG